MASIRLPSASNLLIPEHCDLGNLGVAGGFRRMRDDRTETATVAQEIRDFQLLVAYDEDVGVEPGLIDQSNPASSRVFTSAPVTSTPICWAILRIWAISISHR